MSHSYPERSGFGFELSEDLFVRTLTIFPTKLKYLFIFLNLFVRTLTIFPTKLKHLLMFLVGIYEVVIYFWSILHLYRDSMYFIYMLNRVQRNIFREDYWICSKHNVNSSFFFVLARSQVNLLRYLTQESYVPTSMLCTRIRLTMRLGVTLTFLKFLALIDTAAWRHFSHQLVWFSLAFPLDSFSRTARTRSHVQCWQLSSLGIDLKFRYP